MFATVLATVFGREICENFQANACYYLKTSFFKSWQVCSLVERWKGFRYSRSRGNCEPGLMTNEPISANKRIQKNTKVHRPLCLDLLLASSLWPAEKSPFVPDQVRRYCGTTVTLAWGSKLTIFRVNPLYQLIICAHIIKQVTLSTYNIGDIIKMNISRKSILFIPNRHRAWQCKLTAMGNFCNKSRIQRI